VNTFLLNLICLLAKKNEHISDILCGHCISGAFRVTIAFALWTVLGVVATPDLLERLKRQLLDTDGDQVDVSLLVISKHKI
jgi:hypothetical protein